MKKILIFILGLFIFCQQEAFSAEGGYGQSATGMGGGMIPGGGFGGGSIGGIGAGYDSMDKASYLNLVSNCLNGSTDRDDIRYCLEAHPRSDTQTLSSQDLYDIKELDKAQSILENSCVGFGISLCGGESRMKTSAELIKDAALKFKEFTSTTGSDLAKSYAAQIMAVHANTINMMNSQNKDPDLEKISKEFLEIYFKSAEHPQASFLIGLDQKTTDTILKQNRKSLALCPLLNISVMQSNMPSMANNTQSSSNYPGVTQSMVDSTYKDILTIVKSGQYERSEKCFSGNDVQIEIAAWAKIASEKSKDKKLADEIKSIYDGRPLTDSETSKLILKANPTPCKNLDGLIDTVQICQLSATIMQRFVDDAKKSNEQAKSRENKRSDSFYRANGEMGCDLSITHYVLNGVTHGTIQVLMPGGGHTAPVRFEVSAQQYQKTLADALSAALKQQ